MIKGFIAIILSIFVAYGANSKIDNQLPKTLENIPLGIIVEHSKTKVYASLNNKDPEKYGKYLWHFETSISTIKEDLIIIEFGAFIWDGKEWVFGSIYNRPFNSEEFAKWYSCENALIEKGKTVTDPNNWQKSNQLTGEKKRTLWYYIGENKKGQKFLGTSEVLMIGELEE